MAPEKRNIFDELTFYGYKRPNKSDKLHENI